jgi:hypothetical protein
LDGLVKTRGHSPSKIPKHVLIFILATTVITMEVGMGLPKSILLKKKVEVRNNSIAALPSAVGFIHNEVHLPRKPFTAHSNQTTLAWS